TISKTQLALFMVCPKFIVNRSYNQWLRDVVSSAYFADVSNNGFTNYSGEHITTTHSVYLGSLLKGGIIGLLLLFAVIAGGLWRAWSKRREDSRYGLAIFGYALIFMASQGMFIISNPRETWPLFWLPLGIALSSSLKDKR
ncbi:MAG: hypothetical protein KHZ57_32140, partial [Hungatella hathewayi]|nr:hypothetical protein [Hungatella hathewayi]